MITRFGYDVHTVVYNNKPDFEEYVDENTDVGEDDYDFASVGQGIRSGPNRATRNVNFHGMQNYEDMDRDNIKLKIPNFQGKNDPKAYLEWEKKVDWIFDCHNYCVTLLSDLFRLYGIKSQSWLWVV